MMKYLFYIAIMLFSFVYNEVIFGAVNVKRQNSSSKKVSTKRAATSSGGTKRAATSSSSKSKSKGSSSSGKSKKSSKSSSSTDESSTIKCLQGKIDEILQGDCKFVFDDDIKEALGEQDLYCVFNYRDVGKTSSIYNYYLGAYYGITEGAIKSNNSIINIKNNPKNALKYYEYLIDELNSETLKESKILDSVTEAVLDSSDLDFSVQSTIEKRSVESVPISINVVASDIENCTKLTKAAMTSCGAIGNLDAKNKIAESCTAYNAALIKMAGAKKAEALGYDAELIKVLKQRVNADFYDYKDMVELEQEKLELQKTYSDVKSEQKVLENKNKRSEIAVKASELISGMSSITSEEERKSEESILAGYKKQLCSLDNLISKADSSYVAPDDLADCGDEESSKFTSDTSD